MLRVYTVSRSSLSTHANNFFYNFAWMSVANDLAENECENKFRRFSKVMVIRYTFI